MKYYGKILTWFPLTGSNVQVGYEKIEFLSDVVLKHGNDRR